MRLFIAIELGGIEYYLHKLQEFIPEGGISPSKSFHLTLKFLGEVLPEDVIKIVDCLSAIKFRSFSFSLDGIGFFTSEKFIKVVWVGVNPETEVAKLQGQVDDSLSRFFKKEKDYKAHITLARVMYLENPNKLIQQLKGIKIAPLKVEVKDFRLLKSTITRSGAVYQNIGVFHSLPI